MKQENGMHKVVVMTGILSMLSMLGIGASAQTNEKGQAQGTSVTLKVSGMACGACAARVQKAAKAIDGVTAATVSQPKGTAQITFDPSKTSPESIAVLITKKAGFVAELPKK
ncbi:MAG: cation transporter [Acidobacteria bacterium]|nr:cation transporter [Acidobacteriota bacterium]